MPIRTLHGLCVGMMCISERHFCLEEKPVKRYIKMFCPHIWITGRTDMTDKGSLTPREALRGLTAGDRFAMPQPQHIWHAFTANRTCVRPEVKINTGTSRFLRRIMHWEAVGYHLWWALVRTTHIIRTTELRTAHILMI